MDLRQTCTVCRIDVNISTGGPKNFEIHLASKKHLMNVKAAKDTSKSSSKPIKSTLISVSLARDKDSESRVRALSRGCEAIDKSHLSRRKRNGIGGLNL